MIAQMSTDTLMEAVSYGFLLAHAKTQQDRNELRDEFMSAFEMYVHTEEDFRIMEDFFVNIDENHPLPVVQGSGGEEG